jgi:hypothetical protein
MFEIIKYSKEYEDELMKVIELEGEDWAIYWQEPNASKYRKSLSDSITYIALKDGQVCGYSRTIQDSLFLYVCDLLVTSSCRGHHLGEKLMNPLKEAYPDLIIYIMSGNDEYYKKLDCKKEGSIYLYE